MIYLRRRLIAVALVAVLVTTGATHTAGALAQESGTRIEIPASVFATKETGFIDVLANGQECGQIYFGEQAVPPRDDGTRVFQLDRPTQLAACSQADAALVLVTESGRVLAQTFSVEVGEAMVLDSLAAEIAPPGSPTTLVVNLGVVAYAPDLITSVVVMAGNDMCGEVSLRAPTEVDDDGNGVLDLGEAGPAACSQGGTVLDLANNRGDPLFRHPVVVEGGRVMLAGLGPEAPHTGDPTATPQSPQGDGGSPTTTPQPPQTASSSPTATPQAPQTGGGSPTPGASGDSRAVVGVAAGLVLVALAVATRWRPTVRRS